MSQSNKISAHVCVCFFCFLFCFSLSYYFAISRDVAGWNLAWQLDSGYTGMFMFVMYAYFILRILSSFLFYLAEAWSVSRFPFTPLHFELKLNVASCSRFCGFAHQFSYYLPKLAQISQPVRSEASRCLLARIFPRFPPVTEISCELWLVLCVGYFSCDWLRSRLLLARLQSTLKLSQKQNRNFVFSL